MRFFVNKADMFFWYGIVRLGEFYKDYINFRKLRRKSNLRSYQMLWKRKNEEIVSESRYV